MADEPERGTFRIGGIPIVLPWSSLVGVGLLTWLFAPGFADSTATGAGGYALAAVFALLVYVSILVHELAHAGAARAFGFPVLQIRLYALGGYTAYERTVHTPGRELAISLAGPGATLALAAACWGAGRVTEGMLPAGSLIVELLLRLGYVGLALGIYNLLPGLPLDGGAVVKSAVWKATGSEPTGTRIAAIAGLAVAVSVFCAPFYFAWRMGDEAPDFTTVVAVALFSGWLGMGALDALRRSKVQARLPGLAAASLARRAVTVPRDLPLAEALRRLTESAAGGIVVVDPDGRPTGIAHEPAITAVPDERRPWVSVASVSRSVDLASALSLGLTGEALLDAMSKDPAPEYLVLADDGSIYGVLSTADVQSALVGP